MRIATEVRPVLIWEELLATFKAIATDLRSLASVHIMVEDRSSFRPSSCILTVLVSDPHLVTLCSSQSPGTMTPGHCLLFPCLYLLSASFSAAASLVKERIFQDAPRHLGTGQTMDLFVVNLLGSSFQVRKLAGLRHIECTGFQSGVQVLEVLGKD